MIYVASILIRRGGDCTHSVGISYADNLDAAKKQLRENAEMMWPGASIDIEVARVAPYA